MVGFRSTDAYSNAVLDNWLMIPGTTDIGTRIMGAKIEYDSVTGLTAVYDILGGIGASVTRSSEGLYTIVYESPGQNFLLPFVCTMQADHKALVRYDIGNTGCTVKTLEYTAAWALADVPFCIYVFGR